MTRVKILTKPNRQENLIVPIANIIDCNDLLLFNVFYITPDPTWWLPEAMHNLLKRLWWIKHWQILCFNPSVFTEYNRVDLVLLLSCFDCLRPSSLNSKSTLLFWFFSLKMEYIYLLAIPCFRYADTHQIVCWNNDAQNKMSLNFSKKVGQTEWE